MMNSKSFEINLTLTHKKTLFTWFIPKIVVDLAAFFMKFSQFSRNIVGISAYIKESNFYENLVFSHFLSAKIIWDIGKYLGSFFLAILADLVADLFYSGSNNFPRANFYSQNNFYTNHLINRLKLLNICYSSLYTIR